MGETTCLNCGEHQPWPLRYRAHMPKLEGTLSGEPVREDISAGIFWACIYCGRKHNKDGTLYVPPARTKSPKKPEK